MRFGLGLGFITFHNITFSVVQNSATSLKLWEVLYTRLADYYKHLHLFENWRANLPDGLLLFYSTGICLLRNISKIIASMCKKKKKCVCVTDSNVTTNCQQSVLEPKSIYHLQLIHSGFGILVYDVLCRPGNGFWNICMNPWIFLSLRWLDLIL